MSITLAERQRRADVKVRDIEAQLQVAQGWEGGADEVALQRWRIELLHKWRLARDEEIQSRLALLQANMTPGAWVTKHGYRGDPKSPIYRLVCEAVILEYLLGVYPPARRLA